MANVYATRDGSWSDPMMWNTLAVPTSSDDVYANNFVVQVDVTTSVLSVRTTTATLITAGGTFILNDLSNLTLTGSEGVIATPNAFPVVQFTAGAGAVATITANISGIFGTGNAIYIRQTGLGTLTIVGNYICSATVAISVIVISLNSTGTTFLTGAFSSNAANVTIGASNTIFSNSGGTININGPVTGSNSTRFDCPTVYSTGGANIIHTGNSTAANGNAFTISGGNFTQIGDPLGSATRPAIQNITTASIITINGLITGAIVTSGTGANTVIGLGLVKVSGPIVNRNTYQAVHAPKITIESTTTSITFQKIGGLNQIMYIGTANNTNLPAVSDVRLGTTFGVSNEFTGTMAVQIPANVSQGALVDDNKVGTFLMTPASFVQELGVSTIPVAVRLQNSATVITTGTQLASFNI
jgi:hypothetical protein